MWRPTLWWCMPSCMRSGIQVATLARIAYYLYHSLIGLGVIPSVSQLGSIPLINTSGTVTTCISNPISSFTVKSTPLFMGSASVVNTCSFQDLPPKLVGRILNLEFIDMSELIPESWKSMEEEASCCHQVKVSRRGPVTDILLWVECYATLVAVLASRYPVKVPQMMAYQKTIVKAYKTYSGQGWVTYDTCYRRRAANTKSLDWDVMDFTLYNETFAGRAKVIPRCYHCSSEFHSSAECVQAPVQDKPQCTSIKRPVQNVTPVCYDFNNDSRNKCKFKWCKFAHICTVCRGRHPKSSCPRLPPPSKFSRTSPRC